MEEELAVWIEGSREKNLVLLEQKSTRDSKLTRYPVIANHDSAIVKTKAHLKEQLRDHFFMNTMMCLAFVIIITIKFNLTALLEYLDSYCTVCSIRVVDQNFIWTQTNTFICDRTSVWIMEYYCCTKYGIYLFSNTTRILYSSSKHLIALPHYDAVSVSKVFNGLFV